MGGWRLCPGRFRPARVAGASASRGRPRAFRCRSSGSSVSIPASDRARRTVELIGANSRWDEGGQPYWEGEVEECINGRTVADGAYFGVDVSSIVERLVGERLDDGGWNCERANGSVRSSFAQHDQRAGRAAGVRESHRRHACDPETARKSGEEYLLKRNLFRRLSTGEPADERFLSFLHPNRWRYDVLRALDYFRSSAMLDRRRPRSAARRGYRPRSLQTLGGRHLAARLEPARAGVVRGRRRAGQALAVGDPPGDAGAQMVGELGAGTLLGNSDWDPQSRRPVPPTPVGRSG